MTTTGEPRWLTTEERTSWLALIGLMARLWPALDSQLRRDAGVTFFEYTVLVVLSEAPGRTLRMSSLARLAEGSLSRLSQAVARLEAKGWVRRTPDPEDGRYTLAILTEDGVDKVVASAPGHVAEVRRLVFDPLTKAQARQLAAIGSRIMTAIDPDEPDLPFASGRYPS
ncbi:MarR family winged helix-turn-helix transcriptional regulator [Lentzea rhizosphaerae]|uniref:MarR family winged helix-turn-helix transcriptional regulator n=1 Tax=Lentzea rhizosphaerae TaxID=2041025 RepID=A0ABV8BTK3_9PSEU